MRRRFAVVLAVLAVATLAVPALAHGNYVAVDPQTSAEGSVVVETTFAVVGEGYLAVHLDDGGEPGEVVGHVETGSGEGFRTGVTVPLADEVWAEWGGNRTVHVVLHREASGDGFDPEDDPIQVNAAGEPVAERVVVGKAGAGASVLAERFDPQRTSSGEVFLRRVAMPGEGTVVLRAGNASGPVVATRSLGAGVHREVGLSVDRSVFAERGRGVAVVAQLYVGGAPGDDGARRVTVDGTAVSTRIRARYAGPLNETGESATATPAGTPTPTEALVVTPSGTPTATATPTAAPTTTDTPTPSATASASGGAGPGPGAAGVVTAAALAVLLLARRARRRN
jgi:hypothetical protein